MAPTGTATNGTYLTDTAYYATPPWPTYEERRRLAAIESRAEFFRLLPMIIEVYEQKLVAALSRRAWHKLVFFQLMTVKSTCPPSQRSVKGGRRK